MTYGSSGINVFEIDLNWNCNTCDKYNERTCQAEGDYANAICKFCKYEQEIAI